MWGNGADSRSPGWSRTCPASWAMEVSASELDVEGIADVIVAAFHEEATRHVELDKLKIMHTGIPNDDFAEDSGSQHAVLQELRKMLG